VLVGRRRAAGFTLVELVVAISVAALLLATAPAALDRLYDSMAYRATVRDVLSELKRARNQARQSGEAVAFFVDLQARQFGIDGEAGRSLPAQLEVHAQVAGRELGADGRAAIRFYPDGGATGGSILIERDNGEGVRLRVDWLLGRVSQEVLGG
jgi:general secretion pathway protein H